MAQFITVYEVGPRDGLQNEARAVPTADKLRLLRLLADAGLPRIEATSFVSPKWVPALADAAEAVSQLSDRAGLAYVVLLPAAETHNQKNVHETVDETFAAFADIGPPALARGLRVRGYVSTAWGC